MKNKILIFIFFLFLVFGIWFFGFEKQNFAEQNSAENNNGWILASPKSTPQTKATENKNWISPSEYQKMLGVGIDVDWAVFNKISQYYNNKVPQDFKKRGFSHIRIRVNEKTDLDFLEKVIDDSLEAGLIPIYPIRVEILSFILKARKKWKSLLIDEKELEKGFKISRQNYPLI